MATLIRLAVRCEPDAAEAVLAELVALSPAGVEQLEGDGYVEYAIYGAAGEVPELGDVAADLGGSSVEVSSREVADDWEQRWQRFHRPIEVPGGVRVRPPWAKPAPPRDGLGVELVIEPAGAFGTGAHATTRMCLELLAGRARELAGPGGNGGAGGLGTLGALCDWGTGSGVLAIAARRMGFSPVRAVDCEPASVEAAGRNARENGVELELARADLRREPPPPAPHAVANLTAPLLESIATSLAADGETPSWLAVSGALVEEADAVARAFARAGLREMRRLTEGDWAALELELS